VGDRAVAFNAGDSRVYKITRDQIACLSHDHSLVQGLVDKALIQQDTAPRHPLKNFIEFGIGPAFTDAWRENRVHIQHETVSPGACYLLCSDGLSDLMTAPALLGRLSPSPVENGAALLQTIQSQQPVDNTSFIIAEIR
jgi:PPM family protein phosphatase